MCLMISKPHKTRDAIVEAAFTVFGANPGASILDVAKAAGVGRATLYRHFKDRAELMRSLAKAADRELNQAVEAATKHAKTHLEGLELAMVAMVPLANRQWFLALEPVQNEPEIAALVQAGNAELAYEIDRAKGEGAFASDFSTVWIAEVYNNLIFAAWTMVRQNHASPTNAADLAWRTFMSGTGKRAE